jgi:hypothetical protein
MRVNIEIDELVLHGFNLYDREQVAQAIAQELNNIIKENPRNGLIPPVIRLQNNQISKIPKIEGSFDTVPAASSKDKGLSIVGRSIARSIYDGMKNHNHGVTSKK